MSRFNQLVGETEEEGYVILPYAFKLMEDEKEKVELYELDLGLCLIHVLYIILPCEFIELLGVYKVGQEENISNKMTIMGAKHVIAFPNLFTYYEQDMAKSIICFDYYNNVYQGWHGRWQSMTTVKKGNCEWFKEKITIDDRKKKLKIHNICGWNFLDYLYTPRRNSKLDKWGTIVEKFKTSLENVQELIIKKLHEGLEMWCIQS